MVILFSNPKVREQLLKKGEAVTIRQHTRHVGTDWATAARGTPRICNVHITLLRRFESGVPLSTEDLEPYVEKSGFQSADEWLKEATRYFGKTVYRAYLYHVKNIGDRRKP